MFICFLVGLTLIKKHWAVTFIKPLVFCVDIFGKVIDPPKNVLRFRSLGVLCSYKFWVLSSYLFWGLASLGPYVHMIFWA